MSDWGIGDFRVGEIYYYLGGSDASGLTDAKEGDLFRVSVYPGSSSVDPLPYTWFWGKALMGEMRFLTVPIGLPRGPFRPATPEEIAAHLSTTTPTNTILDRAKSIITGNRQTTNGKPERSFHKIAQRWSLTLGTTVTAQQVALMMVDLKMVRALEGVTTECHDDHFVDMAGYVALAAELGATIPE